MKFGKYQATGNDFIVTSEEGPRTAPSPGDIRKMCRRRTGIGADGLIVLGPSKSADFRMTIFNADGSRAQMCGNGIRALFLYASDRGILRGEEAAVETDAGVKLVFRSKKETGELFTVNMGDPIVAGRETGIRETRGASAPQFSFTVPGLGVLEGSEISMGNPHMVFTVRSVEEFPVEVAGPAVEKDVRFPERTNAEFAEIVSPSRAKLRVWERGVGETLACGTGACATMVAAWLAGLCNDSLRIDLPGGELVVEWKEDGLYLGGEARHVYDGEVDL